MQVVKFEVPVLHAVGLILSQQNKYFGRKGDCKHCIIFARVSSEKKHMKRTNSKCKKAERLTCQRQLAAFVYTDHMTAAKGTHSRRFATTSAARRTSPPSPKHIVQRR